MTPDTLLSHPSEDARFSEENLEVLEHAWLSRFKSQARIEAHMLALFTNTNSEASHRSALNSGQRGHWKARSFVFRRLKLVACIVSATFSSLKTTNVLRLQNLAEHI